MSSFRIFFLLTIFCKSDFVFSCHCTARVISFFFVIQQAIMQMLLILSHSMLKMKNRLKTASFLSYSQWKDQVHSCWIMKISAQLLTPILILLNQLVWSSMDGSQTEDLNMIWLMVCDFQHKLVMLLNITETSAYNSLPAFLSQTSILLWGQTWCQFDCCWLGMGIQIDQLLPSKKKYRTSWSFCCQIYRCFGSVWCPRSAKTQFGWL